VKLNIQKAHGRSSVGLEAGFQPRRGLSLIEVLLSLTILLMSLVAIGQLVDIGSDRSMDARLHVRGTRLAQAKMAEVEAGVVSVSSGANLYLVTVKVTRDVRGRPLEISLAQHLMDPTKMGSAAQAEKPVAATPTTDPATTTGGME
jgi:hypothetical protein